MKVNVNLPRRIFSIFNYIFFALTMLICLYPFWYVIVYSVSDPAAVSRNAMVLIPKSFSLVNYSKVMEIPGILQAFIISILRTVSGSCVTMFACMLLGYLFTKKEMPMRSFLYRLVIITMYVSGGLIPTYIVFKAYGLLNNFAVYILPCVIQAYYIILIKTYVEQIPASLEESAMLDGAGFWTTFLRIILPLSTPIAATVVVFAAVAQWNSWLDNYIYTFSNTNLTTLQLMLYNFVSQTETLIKQIQQTNSAANSLKGLLTPMGVRMTVTVVAVLPILMVYPFLQRYFVKGIMLGAVKG